MKCSCSSFSFARLLQSGALTQLEWIDRCTELKLDGVEFGATHFPRTDDDYLAQLKKLCTDRGLTVAGVVIDVPFGQDDVDPQIDEVDTWIANAASLGAPLLRFHCGTVSGSPPIAWRELIRGLKAVTATAKDRNVTVALEARDGSLVASPVEAKRALKECDSAWLRLALSTRDLRSTQSTEWLGLVDETVALASDGSGDERGTLTLASDRGYIGFVTIEISGNGDEEALVRSALAALRS